MVLMGSLSNQLYFTYILAKVHFREFQPMVKLYLEILWNDWIPKI